MKDDIETKEKQEYLRINILEKGYDADEFMEYLETLRGEKGLQIESWSKNDLIKAVQEFTRINPRNDELPKKENNQLINSSINNNIDNNLNNNINNSINNNDIQNQNIPNNVINNNDDNNNSKNIPNEIKFNNEEIIKCKISEITEISTKNNIEIVISEPKVIEGGFFTKSYVTYLIRTFPLKFEVRRRFSDFEWLRNILMTQYINCIIPPVYKKNYYLGNNYKDSVTNKRIRILEKFMMELITHPLLRNNQILYDFISVKDEKEFNSKKSSYNKIQSPTKVEDIKTLNGEINIGVDNQKSSMAENIKNICDTNQDLMKKLSKEYKLLNLKFEEVNSKINDIFSIWDELYKKSQDIESLTISSIYDAMAKFMEDWKKMNESQIKLINIKIREYFRYIRNEYKSIREYYDIYDNAKNQYLKSYIKLIDTKEYLFNNEDIENWGINKEDIIDRRILLKNKEYSFSKMMPDETKKVDEYKKMYGCYLNSLIDEFNEIKNYNGIRHKDNITKYIRENIDNLTNFHVSLTNLLGYIDMFKEENFK